MKPAKPNTTLVTLDFHGRSLVTFEHDGEPYVAMRSVCEGMSMSWGRQRKKIIEQGDKYSCGLMATTGRDGKRYQMLSMPVRKLPLWLASINPNRIRDGEKRRRIVLYQEQSVMALRDYWKHTDGAHALPAAALDYSGSAIRLNGDRVNLTGMWRAAGEPENREPYNWARKEGAAFIEAVALNQNLPDSQVLMSTRGRNGGTEAH